MSDDRENVPPSPTWRLTDQQFVQFLINGGLPRSEAEGALRAMRLGAPLSHYTAPTENKREPSDPVQAVLAVECPECGMERWPCLAVGGTKMVHLARIRAANRP